MEPLSLKKNGFGLRVYCSKCDRKYNYDTISKCCHNGGQRYKSIVYLGGGKTKVKFYKTRDLYEAMALAITFKKSVKADMAKNDEVVSERNDPNTISVIDAANIYFNFKLGVNVPPHLQRRLSSKHVVSIKKAILDFIQVLKDRGFNVEVMPISSLEDIHVGYWYDYIKTNYSKGSWSSPLSKLKPWISHMINREKVVMYNPFLDVKFEPVVHEIEAISKEEFEGVCKAVETTARYQYIGGRTGGRKNRYRPYLVDAFKLALYTGMRQEEYLTLCWDSIFKIEGGGDYMIISDNLKVQRMTNKQYKKKYIPVHEDLKKLLDELGWQELKDSNHFIIEPFRTVTIGTMVNDCSKGFTHYYKQAFPNRKYKQLKVLRKTYLSYLTKSVEDDVVHFSSHSGLKVLDNHYLDKKVVTKGIDMKIFE